jgi:hypothetical protein
MAAKLLVLILFVTVTAAVVLGYRQQRMQSMHEMALMHAKIDRSRQKMWETQTQIARQLEPKTLQAAVQRAQIAVEPLVPLPALPESKLTNNPTSPTPIGRD